MDNIEEKFYKTFGIKSKYDIYKKEWFIPEITDRILLKMICVLSQSYPLNYEGWSFYTVQELKETILEDCINTAKKLSLSSVFANNIQQLFKGVNNNENR